MANHLLVKRLQRFHVDQYDDGVHEEVAARVYYAPNVQITRHIDTLLVIEDCSAFSAQIKHRNCAYSYAEEGKNWRNYILAVLSSFFRRHLRIGLVECDQDGVPNQMIEEVIETPEAGDAEQMSKVVRWVLFLSLLPKHLKVALLSAFEPHLRFYLSKLLLGRKKATVSYLFLYSHLYLIFSHDSISQK